MELLHESVFPGDLPDHLQAEAGFLSESVHLVDPVDELQVQHHEEDMDWVGLGLLILNE